MLLLTFFEILHYENRLRDAYSLRIIAYNYEIVSVKTKEIKVCGS